jgi:O-antigen/teichoic acid export membrane protein
MTARGLLIRVATSVGAVAVLTLVNPADFGLLAVVRSIGTGIGQLAELGMTTPFLSQQEDPTREDYASLAGIEFAIVLAILATALLWPHSTTVFGTLDPKWRGWLLTLIAAELGVPFATGARIRLERDLQYKRIAFIEVSSMVVHTTILVGSLLAGKFAVGIFAAQIAICLYVSTAYWVSSPGPFPSWHVGRALHRVKVSAGYTVAAILSTGREQAPQVIVAALFDLPTAGAWAFAVRLASFLQFSYEGFARVAIPAAAKLWPDRTALRGLATRTLLGVTVVAVPVATLAVFSLPVVPMFWPQWRLAIPVAQFYVAGDALVGAFAASLAPVALAIFRWRALVIEHSIPFLVSCVGFVLLWRSGTGTLQYVAIATHVAAIVALLIVTEASVLPKWDPSLNRLFLAVSSSALIYIASRALGFTAIPNAIAASAMLIAWMGRPWLVQSGYLQPTE